MASACHLPTSTPPESAPLGLQVQVKPLDKAIPWIGLTRASAEQGGRDKEAGPPARGSGSCLRVRKEAGLGNGRAQSPCTLVE